MMMTWSEEALRSAEPSYRRTLRLPFVTKLIEGTLPPADFRRYLEQDMLYLGVYGRVLAHIASRMEDADMRKSLLTFALDGIAAEEGMHMDFLADADMSRVHPGEACRAYTDFLQARAYDPVEVEMAAVLPCFVIYQRVADHIYRTASLEGHPYRRWIETYADPQFVEASYRASRICDRLAAGATPAVRAQMTAAYAAGAAHEERFWDNVEF